MGFNKRYVSFDDIKENSRNDFESFDSYLTNADSYIFSDKESIKFIDKYWNSSYYTRKKLHKLILKIK